MLCLIYIILLIFHTRFLTLIGGSLNDIGKSEMQQKVNAIIEREGIDGIARMLNTTGHTLQIIIDGLTQPESFDIRKGKTFKGINSVIFNTLFWSIVVLFLIKLWTDRTPPLKLSGGQKYWITLWIACVSFVILKS